MQVQQDNSQTNIIAIISQQLLFVETFLLYNAYTTFLLCIKKLIVRTTSTIIKTREVLNRINNQSVTFKGATLNSGPTKLIITIWPVKITATINANHLLKVSLNMFCPLNIAKISNRRLRPERKYLALKRFQNCNITKVVKKNPAS